MSSENIKKVYILNLDKTRISILAGVFIVVLSFSFLLGLKFQKTENQAAQTYTSAPVPVSQNNSYPADEPLKTLPEEDTKIFSENSSSQNSSDDPFLLDPPERASVKHSIANSPVIKTPVKETAKKEKKEAAPAVKKEKITSGSYYTIQVGAFQHEKDAKSLSNDLRKKGIDARVEKGKLYFFVRVGKTSKKDSLEPVFQKLVNKLQLKALIIHKKNS